MVECGASNDGKVNSHRQSISPALALIVLLGLARLCVF